MRHSKKLLIRVAWIVVAVLFYPIPIIVGLLLLIYWAMIRWGMTDCGEDIWH